MKKHVLNPILYPSFSRFKMLNMLPLEQLITYTRAKFMRNYVYNKMPPSFFLICGKQIEKETIYVNYAMLMICIFLVIVLNYLKECH